MFGHREPSLKKHLDRWDALLAQAAALLESYRGVLVALEQGAGNMPGGEGLQFHEAMSLVNAQMKGEPRPRVIRDSGTATEKAWQGLVDVINRREVEYREIVRMLANTSASIAQAGAGQAAELKAVAGRIADDVVKVESLSEARRLVGEHVGKLEGMAKKVQADAAARAQQMEIELASTRERFKFAAALAETDPLTGLANRRKGETALDAAIAAGGVFSIFFVDLDGFKAINHRYGHQQGDSLLKVVGQHMRRSMRENDLVCRWGGDEFMVLLRGAPLAAAENSAARMQTNAFGQFMLSRDGEDLRVSISASVGVAEYTAPESKTALLARAEGIMRQRKAAAKAAAAGGAAAAAVQAR